MLPLARRSRTRARRQIQMNRYAVILGAALIGAALLLLSSHASDLASALDGRRHQAAAPIDAGVAAAQPDPGAAPSGTPGSTPRAPTPAATSPTGHPAPAPAPGQKPGPVPAPAPTPPAAPPPMSAVSRPAPQPQPVLPPAQPDYARLQADLTAILRDYGPRSALWFEDLSTGKQIVIGADERFHPASTVKLPIVVALIEGAQKGRWKLTDQWAISADDWEDGAGSLQNVPAGTQFALQELARRAIEESDNVAANALARKVGFAAVRDSMRQAGAALSTGTLTSLGVADLGAVLDSLAKRSADDPKTWGPLLDWLSHTTMNEWLPAPLPNSFTVYHKWGAYGDAEHDAGIVTGPGVRYALVICTDGTRDGGALIRALSGRVLHTFPASTLR